jgi:hypothetical protein
MAVKEKQIQPNYRRIIVVQKWFTRRRWVDRVSQATHRPRLPGIEGPNPAY